MASPSKCHIKSDRVVSAFISDFQSILNDAWLTIFPFLSAPSHSCLHKESGWPSGLRRCVQVAVSLEAWVRIPLLTRPLVCGIKWQDSPQPLSPDVFAICHGCFAQKRTERARHSCRQRVVVAEWLRRWTRNPLGSPRAGSNPADYVHYCIWGQKSGM